jgi:hypothetical protein
MPLDGETDDAFSEEVAVFCRHFLSCRTVWFDPAKPDEFSLGRLIVHLPPEGDSFPTEVHRLFVFGQLYGEPGEYACRIRLVRIERVAYDEEAEIPLGVDGGDQVWRPNRPLVVSGDDFVDSFAIPLNRIPIPESGTYEYQLFIDDEIEPIARERFSARERQ